MLPEASAHALADPSTGADEERLERYRYKLVTLLFLFWAYFSFNLVLRWLRWSLLSGQAKNGWSAPSVPVMLYQVFMSCLPVAFWGWFAYVVARRFPRLCNRAVLMVLFFVFTAAAELDMNWFIMSRSHLTFADASAFLAGSPDDMGMDGSEIMRFVMLLVRHAVAIGVLWLVSIPVAHYLFKLRLLARAGVGWRKLGLVLGLLVLVDSVWIGYCSRHDRGQYNPSQWGFAAYANPARIDILDRLWRDVFCEQPDLEAANQALSAAVQGSDRATRAHRGDKPASPRPDTVVVVAVESMNARLVKQTPMPFWKGLASRSLQMERHYSTGNCTQYGVLGLLYGSPPVFYNGALGQDQSPYLDLFAERGFHTRRITSPMAAFRNMGDYLARFTQPAFEERDEWVLLPQAHAFLSQPGPHLLFLFYNKTHYPYRHADSFTHFTPEVPEDFHFQSWDAVRHADEITNRYKNCLLEFDAWLHTLVKGLDMERTILVVTGDHGEEFFETGRLGHCSYLNDAQTQVPCLIAIPGGKGSTFAELSSHADIMPTLMDVLGWRTPPCYGQSILHGQRPRAAVVAQNNQNHRPTVWAVMTEGKKTIVEGRNTLEIIALLDSKDRKLPFGADTRAWADNFAEVQRFRRALLAATVPGTPLGDGPLTSRQR
jgi:Sulfatase